MARADDHGKIVTSLTAAGDHWADESLVYAVRAVKTCWPERAWLFVAALADSMGEIDELQAHADSFRVHVPAATAAALRSSLAMRVAARKRIA